MKLDYNVKISQLSEDQKGHLAWRLDSKTYCGYLTACRIARGEFGDLSLLEVFKRMDKSEHAAKIHARKVLDYSVAEALAKLKPEDRMKVVNQL